MRLHDHPGGNPHYYWINVSNGKIKNLLSGKSRIPVPVRITRFAGHSSIEQIGLEILGLSKMDWNSFDLYSKMPATLGSSRAIARVGQLLTRFGNETYDYRLFI